MCVLNSISDVNKKKGGFIFNIWLNGLCRSPVNYPLCTVCFIKRCSVSCCHGHPLDAAGEMQTVDFADKEKGTSLLKEANEDTLKTKC